MNKDSIFEDCPLENNINGILPAIARIQQYKTEVGFRTLVEGVEDNLYVVPNFQRVYRWTFAQANNLAVSLFLGLPIPPIYVYRNKDNQLEILDGQQRIISLYMYYKGIFTKAKRSNQMDIKKIGRGERKFGEELEYEYEMKNVDYEIKYKENNKIKKENINYERLKETERRLVDYRTLTIVEINVDAKGNRQKLLCKIFANLNAGGEPLSRQELRNGIYQCPFYDMIMELNDNNEKWRRIFGKENKKSEDIQTLLRFCAMKYYTEFKNDKIEFKKFDTYAQLLDDFSDECQNFRPEVIDEYRRSLENFINKMPIQISKKVMLWETLFLITDKMGYDKRISAKVCREIENDKEYQSTVNSGTAKKSRIEKRLKCVYKLLQ